MKKTISVFTLKNDKTSVSFSTNKQAVEAKEVLNKFGVIVELEKTKKVIEL